MRLIQIAEPTDQYVGSFSWNKIRYRADKSLGELIDTLRKVGGSA
jgi:V-type H+-transporting ATPase subunit C